MGRKAKPTKLKELEGHTNKQVLRSNPATSGSPQKPRGLTLEASKLWNHIVPQLEQSGVASKVDSPALQSMCEWWSSYRENYKAYRQKEPGSIEAGRCLTAATKSFDRFVKLASEFGLTPASRNALDVKQSEADHLGKFFK